jgi:hypothetical protein
MESPSKAAAEEIRRRFLEALERRGLRMSDPNDWLTEAEIAEIIKRHLATSKSQ